MDALLDTISTWPDFSAYYEKLRRVRMDVIERWRKTYDVNQNHFNTFVHDDLWPANIMMTGVKPSEETPFENVVFIDFQLSFWASPTIDLHFFLNTSVCDSYRPHRFDELVESYHECLVSYLKQLKFKGHIPTWTEFYAQYQERKLLGSNCHLLAYSTFDMTVILFICFDFLLQRLLPHAWSKQTRLITMVK